MRALALLVLAAAQLHAAERPFDYPVSSRAADVKAVFTKAAYHDTQREGTKLTVKARDGKIIFEGELTRDVACNAEWTHDGKFLAITATNGGGHSPWHFWFYVFSLDAREIREYRETDNAPVIVSADMFFQPPHTVILIGHTFQHGLEAPEDPVLVRLDLAALWPKLEKV
jgi:hypothetical protein